MSTTNIVALVAAEITTLNGAVGAENGGERPRAHVADHSDDITAAFAALQHFQDRLKTAGYSLRYRIIRHEPLS